MLRKTMSLPSIRKGSDGVTVDYTVDQSIPTSELVGFIQRPRSLLKVDGEEEFSVRVDRLQLLTKPQWQEKGGLSSLISR